MRLSAQPECSRALIQASTIACVISSTLCELMPSSRARFAAARAAAISMSSTIGRMSSICRSAVGVMLPGASKREEKGNGGLHPARDSTQLLESEKSAGVDGEQRRDGKRHRHGSELAGLSEVVHGCPLRWEPPKSNRTAIR